uniref:Ig-like domain-containing protein n=1 Tax=Oreochromis aureus TaxID=47969 RepID=A0A668U6V1_OREAU
IKCHLTNCVTHVSSLCEPRHRGSLSLHTVQSEQGDVIAAEGDTVTLGCRYETSYAATLIWYKQEANSYPKYMLHCVSETTVKAEEFKNDRFDAKINEKQQSVPLKIQKLQLSDSAVYYCALQPTVTGNTKTLYKNLWSKDNRILHNIH